MTLQFIVEMFIDNISRVQANSLSVQQVVIIPQVGTSTYKQIFSTNKILERILFKDLLYLTP